MELTSTDIVEATGKIIMESGLNAISIEELSRKMEINHEAISSFFKGDNNILNFMLHNIEFEIKELIYNSEANMTSAEEEFQRLFKDLYLLFAQKPYYLFIILNIEDKENVKADHENLTVIKASIEKHLQKIIKQGKMDKTFKTNRTPGALAKTILKSFQSFMNYENLMNKMNKDLKTLREKPEYL